MVSLLRDMLQNLLGPLPLMYLSVTQVKNVKIFQGRQELKGFNASKADEWLRRARSTTESLNNEQRHDEETPRD